MGIQVTYKYVDFLKDERFHGPPSPKVNEAWNSLSPRKSLLF